MDISPIAFKAAYNWFFPTFQTHTGTYFNTDNISPPNIFFHDNSGNIMQFKFQLSNIIINESWVLSSFMGMIGDLGGVTAILTMMLSSVVTTYVGFQVDNSMINSLFTVQMKKKNPKRKFFGHKKAAIPAQESALIDDHN